MACGISCTPLWTEPLVFPQYSSTLSDVKYTNEQSRVNRTNHVSLRPKVFKPVVLYQSTTSHLDELKTSLELSSVDNNCKKRTQTNPSVISDIRYNGRDGLNDGVHLLQNNNGHLINYKCDAFDASSVCSIPGCGVSNVHTMHTTPPNLCEIRPFLEADLLQVTSNSLERQSIDRSDNRQLPRVSFPFAAQQLANQTESFRNPYNVLSDLKSYPQDIRSLHGVILDLHHSPSTLRPETNGCFHSYLDVSSNQNYIASNFTCDTMQRSKSYLDSLGPQWDNWQFLNLLPVSCSTASVTQLGQCHSSVIAGKKDNIYSESQTLTKTKRIFNGGTTCSYASIDISDSRLYQAERQLENVGIGIPNNKRKDVIITGNRPYSCQCGRAFTRNEELTRHQRIHSGYKPHQCHICCKLFGRKDHLNKHLKTHLTSSEKKVHVCNVPNCGQSYTRSDALARHQMNSHGIRARPSKWRPQKKE